MAPTHSLALAAAATAAVALLAWRLDRRRGIGPLSFLPWDLILIAAVLSTLILATRGLRLWLAA